MEGLAEFLKSEGDVSIVVKLKGYQTRLVVVTSPRALEHARKEGHLKDNIWATATEVQAIVSGIDELPFPEQRQARLREGLRWLSSRANVKLKVARPR